MINYNISVLSTYVKPLDNNLKNVVFRVTWVYQAKENFHVAEIFKDTLLPVPTQDNFICFDDLTEKIIIDWISSIEDMELTRNQVTESLLRSKNPMSVEKPIPFNKNNDYTYDELYVVTNQEKIVFGPKNYDSSEFNKILSQYGFDNPLPVNNIAYRTRLVPINEPLEINDKIKIYRALIKEDPIYDKIFYKLTPVWSFDTGIAICENKIERLNLSEIQAKLYEELLVKEKLLIETSKTIKIGELKYTIYPTESFASMIASKLLPMSDTDTSVWYDDGLTMIDVNRSTLEQILRFTNSEIDKVRTYIISKNLELNKCKTYEEFQQLLI